jgi:hypothetical protein
MMTIATQGCLILIKSGAPSHAKASAVYVIYYTATKLEAVTHRCLVLLLWHIAAAAVVAVTVRDVVDAIPALPFFAQAVQPYEILLRVTRHLRRRATRHKRAADATPVALAKLVKPKKEQAVFLLRPGDAFPPLLVQCPRARRLELRHASTQLGARVGRRVRGQNAGQRCDCSSESHSTHVAVSAVCFTLPVVRHRYPSILYVPHVVLRCVEATR